MLSPNRESVYQSVGIGIEMTDISSAGIHIENVSLGNINLNTPLEKYNYVIAHYNNDINRI